MTTPFQRGLSFTEHNSALILAEEELMLSTAFPTYAKHILETEHASANHPGAFGRIYSSYSHTYYVREIDVTEEKDDLYLDLRLLRVDIPEGEICHINEELTIESINGVISYSFTFSTFF